MERAKQGFERAKAILRQAVHPMGFKASVKAEDYHQIWMRDSAISMLAALEFEEFLEPAKNSLETLKKAQCPGGWIPNNVDVKTGSPEPWGPDGFDNNSWYVIAASLFFQKTNDKAFLESHWPHIEKALEWLRLHESSHGMLYIGEAGDWQDLFATRAHGLYANVLYRLAAREAVQLADRLKKSDEAGKWRQKVKSLTERLNERLWFDAESFLGRLLKNRRITADWEHTYLKFLSRSIYLPYYLAFLGFREVGSYFDSFGNLLAVLTGAASPERTRQILDFMKKTGLDLPYPTRSIYPAAHPGEVHWRDYYQVLNLNLPHQYHNGGIWPFLGGFQVLALIKANRQKEAQAVFERLTEACFLGIEGQWEFNEWLHGRTGRPAGKPLQTWSAALYILAYKSLQENFLPSLFR